MDKSPDAFRTISEVAEWLGVQAHVLRFWESKFTHVKPVKRAGGRRYYRPSDMQLLGGIKKLLHDDGLTIKGVQKILREQGAGHVSSLSQELCDAAKDAAKTIESKAPPSDSKEASVVPFKSTAAKSAKPGQTPASKPDRVAKVTPVDVEDDAPSQTPDAAVTAEPVAAPPAPPPAAAVEDKPILPSFLHRPTPVADPEPKPAPEPEPVIAEKRARVIDAPDPPGEADLPYTTGPLAQLAGLDRLSARQVATIAPLAKELQAWLARAAH